jgi:hypothetical protein
MAGKFWLGVRRFVMWDYPRASWQYDLMVALILAFVFLTPREWFRDQPRPSSIVMLEGHAGTDVVWIAPEVLAAVPKTARQSTAAALIQKKFGKEYSLVRLDPILDAESEITGYMALVKP